jgi:hypothetical protein
MNSQSTLSSGYWSLEKSQPLIDKTQTIRLSPDLSQLTEGERKAVENSNSSTKSSAINRHSLRSMI